MADTNVKVAGSGMGFTGGLALLFIALKLLDKIDWSWVWVLAPLWIPWAIVLAILLIVGIVIGLLFIIAIVVGALSK